MVIRYAITILVFCLIFMGQSSYSHTPERVEEPVAKHGGIAKRAGPYNIEIVRKGKCLTIYVNSKNNTKLSTARSTAKAVMFVKGDNPEISLIPNGSNLLYGCCDVTLGNARMAKMQLKIFGKEPVSKLFVLK